MPPAVPARATRAHDEACFPDLSLLAGQGPGSLSPQLLPALRFGVPSRDEGPAARTAPSSGPPRPRPAPVAIWRPASCSCGPEDAARPAEGLHLAFWENKAG